MSTGNAISRGMSAAAGYHQYGGNGLFCPPQIRMGVLERFWESSFLPYISCTDYKIEYGKCMVFDKFPDIKIKPLQKNQVYKPEVWEPLEVKVKVGEANYFAHKIDKYDHDKMCNSSAYQNAIIEGAQRTLHEKIACEMLAYIVANVACENTGETAGAMGHIPINTGFPGAPIPISASNFEDLYLNAEDLLSQHNIYVNENNPAIGNGFVMIIPSALKKLMIRSEIASDLLVGGCDDACNMLINGMLPKKLLGWQTITTNCMPYGTDELGEFEGYYVIAMASCAMAFGGIKQDVWIKDGKPRDNGIYLVGEFEHGYHLFYPEGVVVFYVTPDTGV